MKIYIVVNDCNYDGCTILGAFKKEDKAKEFRIKSIIENKNYLAEEVFIEEVDLK